MADGRLVSEPFTAPAGRIAEPTWQAAASSGERLLAR